MTKQIATCHQPIASAGRASSRVAPGGEER
jgi:hypothetical protein